MDNLINLIPKLALDSHTRNDLDYTCFKDRNYWYSISKRSFLVEANKIEITTTYNATFLLALVTSDIIILLAIPYEERSIYISSIWSANIWLPWRKIG